ncbi:hypothetical protein COB64_04055, partial [Candidatus Wolfebacteria bacterium]
MPKPPSKKGGFFIVGSLVATSYKNIFTEFVIFVVYTKQVANSLPGESRYGFLIKSRPTAILAAK